MPRKRSKAGHYEKMFIAALACVGLTVDTASGETVKEALTAAYLYNPTLKAARAQLRSTDNTVSQAKAGYRPRITGTVGDGYESTTTKTKGGAAGSIMTTDGNTIPLSSLGGGAANGTYAPRTAQLALTQNVFDGFRTYNGVKGAEASVEAGREDLRNTEETILLAALTSYMNVVRDQAIVNLRQNNVKVLAEQLRATQDRFKVGEVTRTEVSQAQATLAGAQSDLAIAQATLSTNRSEFARLIGHAPGSLKDPGPITRLLPKTIAQALQIGQAENPLILGALFRERAQQHAVKQVKGELLPTLSLNASYTHGRQTTSPGVSEYEDTKVTGNLSIPLYEGGEVSARIREAIETLSQRRQQIDEQREQVRANVTAAWGQLESARGTVASGNAQVEAANIALQGIREEERVGQRTILDVLNAEQTSLNARVNLVSFQRDLVVASYSVLSAMGRLTASDVALQAELYDPTRNYDAVKNKIYGWDTVVDKSEDPAVSQVRDPGKAADQSSKSGPAYTQKLPPIP